MHKRFFTRLVLLSAFLVFVAAPAAYAQISIAVVDIEALMSDSTAAKSIKQQVETNRKKFETEMEGLEKQLRDSLEKLKAESKDLSKEDLEKKAQEFEEKRFEARKTLKSRIASLNKGSAEAMNTLTSSIFKVCAKLADEKKYDLIITRNNVIVGAKSLDITPEVMKRLNDTLPDVKVTIGK
ncbi:MAG: OmpH family outer membrane protein [Alphaproteobacteria bacterium]|nr:OmpH family outer membrane protein [Alphaproteobacteria bacterium]